MRAAATKSVNKECDNNEMNWILRTPYIAAVLQESIFHDSLDIPRYDDCSYVTS